MLIDCQQCAMRDTSACDDISASECKILTKIDCKEASSCADEGLECKVECKWILELDD